ncbi:hypothetical protein CPB85DRAFT_1251853 [Mucidula mucida]|nr:hypothetical protein CPB85DRAFT_1251853 [Mucidula mucida]
MAILHDLFVLAFSFILAVRALMDTLTQALTEATSTILGTTFPDGQQEPINMIISGASDSDVLKDQSTHGGLRNYFLSCHSQAIASGKSTRDQRSKPTWATAMGCSVDNQTAVMRYNYGDTKFGTCTETINGGNHFRYWVQNGTDANSGAVFMAVSYEMPAAKDHDIVPNGYNFGRDYIVGNITGSAIPTSSLSTADLQYSGTSSSEGYTYKTDVTYTSGLLTNTSVGINHNVTVAIDGVTNAVDGLVAVLDVSITTRPDNESSSGDSGAGSSDDSDSALSMNFVPSLLLATFILPIFTLL